MKTIYLPQDDILEMRFSDESVVRETPQDWNVKVSYAADGSIVELRHPRRGQSHAIRNYKRAKRSLITVVSRDAQALTPEGWQTPANARK